MTILTKILSFFYFLAGIIFIATSSHAPFATSLLFKALIMPVLMILFITNIKVNLNRLNIMIIAALFFSWSGDIILEFSQKNSDMFVPGLLSFLLAHLMYIFVFLNTPGVNILKKRIYLVIPVLVYGIALIVFLYPDLGEMRVPVLIYAMVILTMLVSAINRFDKVGKKSFNLVLIGAILFVISDSTIAINKFSYPFEASGIVIMSTYVLAQYLIIWGYISQYRVRL